MNAKTFLAERFLKHRTLCWSILDIKLSFLSCFYVCFANFGHQCVDFAMILRCFLMILDSGENCVCQFCGIFGGFLAVVEPILHERCLSQVVPLCLVPEIALPRGCRADDFGWFGHRVHFLRFFQHFLFFFFRGGSNMVAFRAKVDGTWEAKFQRRLRYRVAGLRPSGLPNLPFSLSLPFPPSSSNSFPFPNFSSFHPFPSSLPFFFTLFSTVYQ